MQTPPHLREHVAKQNYKLYTAIDHASWRFIMRISKAFFAKHAHPKYIKGLEQTGITIDRIPRISEMDKKLKKFKWSAVTVTGFIPPAVFLEFQSLSILPIACDMRRLEHLEYTPSPDIVHEAAGHAPIIADPSYARYLHKFGEIARKAIFAKEDLEVYEAIKYLSDIKEDPKTTREEIDEAYLKLEQAHARNTYASEATKLSRLGWWSIEYGLVKMKGDHSHKGTYKIYGAGLLSSVGESYNAIMGHVKKVKLDIDCTNVDYDITKPQPQLFYVEDFKELEGTIDELGQTMAYKIGGLKALERARVAGTVTTTQLDTGLQISGVLTKIHTQAKPEDLRASRSQAQPDPSIEKPVYLQYAGPVQLAYADQELQGHSAKYHAQGFGTPVGAIKTQTLLKANHAARLEFESGVIVDGIYVKSITKNKKPLVHTFKNCTVKYHGQMLFDPAWGPFDMACGGESIPSVFGGAADRAAYLKATTKGKPKMKTQTSNLTPENKDLEKLYAHLRKLREKKTTAPTLVKNLTQISHQLDQNHPKDWLLRLETLELIATKLKKQKDVAPLAKKLHKQLDDLSAKSEVLATLIKRGRELLH